MSEVEKPLVTFALFAYNQERFIREAVEGALSQTYSPLEIILSDDCSTDQTFQIMEELASEYTGKNRVIVRRNERNVGVCEHVNLMFSIASGQFMVVAAGDDISLPIRTKRLVELWQRSGVSAVYSNAIKINSHGIAKGNWQNSPVSTITKLCPDKKMRSVPYYGAGAAYDLNVFHQFGKLPNTTRNEDYNLALRAALLNGIGWTEELLFQYRYHENNLSFWVQLMHAESYRKRFSLLYEDTKNQMRNHQEVERYVFNQSGENSVLAESYRINRVRLELRSLIIGVLFCRRLDYTGKFSGVTSCIFMRSLMLELKAIVAWPIKRIGRAIS